MNTPRNILRQMKFASKTANVKYAGDAGLTSCTTARDESPESLATNMRSDQPSFVDTANVEISACPTQSKCIALRVHRRSRPLEPRPTHAASDSIHTSEHLQRLPEKRLWPRFAIMANNTNARPLRAVRRLESQSPVHLLTL